MDPFSTAGAAVGLVDICARLAHYLHQLQKDCASVDSDLKDLDTEIQDLSSLCSTLSAAVVPASISTHGALPGEKETTANSDLWARVYVTLESCKDVLDTMGAILAEIYAEKPENEGLRGRISRGKEILMKVHRKRSREDDLQEARNRLARNMSALQLYFGAISRQEARFAQLSTARSYEDLSIMKNNLLSFISNEQRSIATSDESYDKRSLLNELRELEASIIASFSAITTERSNKFFDIPQPVSPCYVGREDLLLELRRSLSQHSTWGHNQKQWRFVVQGIGGSGKTQFCSKFAEENRQSFWGVFKCNGSDETTLRKTIGNIALLDKQTADVDITLQWLSSITKRWLLIIDNADDERIDLTKYFPNNSMGHILVSTRVPAFQRYGTVGPAYYDFTERALSEEEATNLLLRESLKSSPKNSAWKLLALKITKSLGYLALAICHAGGAIRNGLCDLADFHEFYDASWRSLRNSSGLSTDPGKQHEVCAITTWEMCYKQLEVQKTQAVRDAIHLLKIFAFLHCEDIPRELLTRAMQNSQLEAEQAQKDQAEEGLSSGWKHMTWSEWLSSKQLEVMFLLTTSGSSPLPGVIQHGRKPENYDQAHMRIRYALKELTQRSLITRNDNKTYTMHTIVHRWARMRPQMGLQEQSRWADAAARILSTSILIPPLGMKTSDETYHLSLFSHVEHVQKCRKAIAEEMKITRNLRWIPWLNLSRIVGREKLLVFGKFSVVYAQSGRYDKAEELLTVVNDILCRSLGPYHPRTRRITILLAAIYWKRSKPQQASSLRNQMLQDCERHYGREHPETLRAMRDLGNSLWQQGRYSDAMELQQEAFDGLQVRLGLNHPDTLRAADQFGLTVVKFFRKKDIEKAYCLHDVAVKGMQRIHGEEHHRTLDAKQNLSRVSLLRTRDDFATAHDLMKEVLDANERNLGSHAPETLLAMINMAITKCAIGAPSEGEALMRKGLPIGEGLYGSSHIAVLWGKSILGITLTHQRRFKEAQDILKTVATTQKNMAARRGDYHPDRIATLIELARCYHLQGKMRESMEVCEEALKGLQDISRPGKVHIFTEQLRPIRDMLAKGVEEKAAELQGETKVVAPPQILFPSIHFLDSHIWEHPVEVDLVSLVG